jgi:hypothetical protein
VTWSHASIAFCRYDHIFAIDAQILEGLSEHFLAAAFRVNICSIEKIDTTIDAVFDDIVRFRLIGIADHFK